MSDKFRREAIANIPCGFYVLPSDEPLLNSDLVWDWTSKKFLRADSPLWLFDTFSIPPEEIVCAVRRAELTGFETAKRRTFTLKR